MGGLIDVENRVMVAMFAVVVIVVIGLDVIIKALCLVGAPFRYLVLLRLVHPLVCAFVLFAEYELLHAKHADNERAETERLLANIEREVNVYDAVVETGNEALDTILTEKSLTCSGEGIVLTVIAEGSSLGFMAPADIYSLFGNALDNAIEAVRDVTDAERRTIAVSVQRRGQMVAVSVENCCAHVPRIPEGGLPETTKNDRENHGFGMRSMRQIAERYGGSLHAGVESDVFYLNVLLAMPT